ncbi:MAG: metal-dependent hydrolase [Anaerosolibacter sp.]|uniref:MYG1 family protein n=1 Tax=Anaerosolibacter sp. TaxID=1872527 RepID=UPI0026134684|nr:MYG1 family protein [Anaerosolibacter sp.]MDF2545182.1 metal-dependent hydrolase [Anaerosolibacter sp.]
MVNIDTKRSFKKVGTHDGRFHADEVMATAILDKLFELEVVRTRDTRKLGALDIVYDVGGGEFDHHGVEKIYRESGTPYAACGLIWNHFGRNVIHTEDSSLTMEEVESVFDYVDRFLIEGIDAHDNGLKVVDEIIPSMNISAIISGFNPPWYAEEKEEEAFYEAVEVGKAVLQNTMSRKIAILKAKDKIIQSYENRDRSEFLVLDTFCPWEEALQEIDEEGEVVFIIYPDKGRYSMQTVRGRDGKTRKNLPKSWAGKENEELSAITGVDDAIFCHTGRFIAVAGSFEGIQKLAEIAIDYHED